MKEINELLKGIKDKKAEVRAFVEADELDKAESAKEELKALQKALDLLGDLDDAAAEDIADKAEHETKLISDKKDGIALFAKAAKSGFKNMMTEGTKADGGYTVPEDVQTKINEYRDSKFNLRQLVTVEKVTTNKGSRTYKTRGQQTGFTKVAEGGKIGKKDTPKFSQLSYEIAKYGGYFPVTNELLADSDANITSTLINWIGDESRVTGNNLILDVAKATTNTATIKTLDDIKQVLNVKLGAAFKSTSVIVTNDDGLQFLDTLKDANGRDLLQPNPTEPAQLRLRAGATTVPINVIGNDDFPSDTSKNTIPFLIGDLKEGIVFYDRNQLTIKSSDIAAAGDLNAFEEDLTLFRAIEREDVKLRDEKAFVYCTLSTAGE